MRIRIIRHIKKILNQDVARKTFVEFVEMRQRLFEAQYGKALCLDRYDLISDHVVIYEDSEFSRPMAYVRSITAETCQEYDVPLPLEQIISHSPEHVNAFKEFEAQVPLPVHMGYLCLDMRYKSALGGIKLVDLLTWMGFVVPGPQPGRMGLCATLNSKFHQNAWLESVGPAVQGIARLAHPVIPDPHDLLLIPSIRSADWGEQPLKFGSLLDKAEWLVPAAAEAGKRAA
jgi:hypothetical protein